MLDAATVVGIGTLLICAIVAACLLLVATKAGTKLRRRLGVPLSRLLPEYQRVKDDPKISVLIRNYSNNPTDANFEAVQQATYELMGRKMEADPELTRILREAREDPTKKSTKAAGSAILNYVRSNFFGSAPLDWDASRAYKKGEIAFAAGTTWVSLKDENRFFPPEHPEVWKEQVPGN